MSVCTRGLWTWQRFLHLPLTSSTTTNTSTALGRAQGDHYSPCSREGRVCGGSRRALPASGPYAALTYPAGEESDTGCSCIVSSPSFVKAAPAAEKISPTWGRSSVTGAGSARSHRGLRLPAPAPRAPAGSPARGPPARGRQGAPSAREVEPWWTLTSWPRAPPHGDAPPPPPPRELETAESPAAGRAGSRAGCPASPCS